MKRIIAYSAIAAVLLTLVYFSSSPSTIKFLNQEQPATPSLPVLKYSYNSVVNSKQFAEPAETSEENVQIFVRAQCSLAVKYDNLKSQFQVYMAFDQLDIKQYQMNQGQRIDDSYFTETNEEDDQIVYIATLDDITGKVLSLRVPKSVILEYQELVKWVVVDIFRLTFSQIKATLYSNAIYEQNELEHHQLGLVRLHYEQTNEEGHVMVKKYFTQNDFLSFKYDIGGETPEIQYELVSFLDKEQNSINFSRESSLFSTASKIEYRLVRNTEGELEAEPIVLQNVELAQNSEISLLLKGFNEKLVREIEEYIAQNEFIELDIKIEGESIVYDYNEPIVEAPLSDPVPTYHFDYSVVSMSMLGQQFGIKASYDNFGEYSKMMAYVFVNAKNIKTLVQAQYNHCPGKNRDVDNNQNQNIKLFRVKWPILVILSIEFEASLNLNYGYKWYYGPDQRSSGCLIKFQPYFKAGLQADGSVSIEVAKAGMYAAGNIAASYLSFDSQIKDAITPTSKAIGGSVQLSLTVNPFEYEIGAYYQLIKCNWKKLVTLHFKKVCEWGDRHKSVLVSGKVGASINKVLFYKAYEIKL